MCCLVGVHLQQSLHVVANINVCLVNAGKHITTSGTVALLCNTSKQVTLELLLSDNNKAITWTPVWIGGSTLLCIGKDTNKIIYMLLMVS